MFRDWFRWRHESEAVGMKQNLPGGNSAVVPPDPMPNSEVKRRSADGSVGSPHARVGHCQALIKVESLMRKHGAFCCAWNTQSRTQNVGAAPVWITRVSPHPHPLPG
jgi:hypothetical protein